MPRNSARSPAEADILASMTDGAVDVFISYAPEDEALRCRLDSHLAPLVREGLIRPWHRGLLGAGEDRRATAAARLAQARIILLLVSDDFLVDGECRDDIKQAIRRQAGGGARVISIILRPCDWTHETFACLAVLPKGGAPLASSPDPESVWADVTARIEQVVAETRLTWSAVTPERPRRVSIPGGCEARGLVLRSVDRALIDACGRSARAEVVARVPGHCREDLCNESIDSLGWYDLEELTAYMELSTSLMLQDRERWRDFGRAAAGGELHQLVRSAFARPTTDIALCLNRAISILMRLFTCGSWRINTRSAPKVVLTVGLIEPPSVPLRLWIVGVIEEIARRAVSSDVKVVITLGESECDAELICEISL